VPISPNILSTIVLCIAFVCQLLLESTDPSLTGWGRLIVRAIQMADMVVLMQRRRFRRSSGSDDMDGNELATRIERQLDLIFSSVQRLERGAEAHEVKHERIEIDRRDIERRVTSLEASSKTKWSLVVSIVAVLVSVLSQIFGLKLGVQ
jgi:hypothetical protein